MTKKSGYKDMMRDRVPKMVDLALRFCKCKNLWLDHVYTNFIKIHVHKKDRYDAARACLGIKEKKQHLDFKKTIMWDNMTAEEEKDWLNVCDWVEYFQTNYQVAEQRVEFYKKEHPNYWYVHIEDEVREALPSQADNYPLIRFIALSLTTK